MSVLHMRTEKIGNCSGVRLILKYFMVLSEVVLWAMSEHCSQLYAQQVIPITSSLVISENVKRLQQQLMVYPPNGNITNREGCRQFSNVTRVPSKTF
jgi:hypothetical protein